MIGWILLIVAIVIIVTGGDGDDFEQI